MGLALKVAAGIVLGIGILYVVRVLFVLGLLAGFAHYVGHLTTHNRPVLHAVSQPRPGPTQYNAGPSDAQINAEAARAQAQKARCMVKKADGTVLYCDPQGPFTPR
jgi:hypothetical protein